MEICLYVLKESNKSWFRQLQCQEQCIAHIPYYLSGLSQAHFFLQPTRKSCIQTNVMYMQGCRCDSLTLSLTLWLLKPLKRVTVESLHNGHLGTEQSGRCREV